MKTGPTNREPALPIRSFALASEPAPRPVERDGRTDDEVPVPRHGTGRRQSLRDPALGQTGIRRIRSASLRELEEII